MPLKLQLILLLLLLLVYLDSTDYTLEDILIYFLAIGTPPY
jgi:hypothetical protein